MFDVKAQEKQQEENLHEHGRSPFASPDFVDNRPEATVQQKLQETANQSIQVKQFAGLQAMANNSPQVQRTAQLKSIMNDSTPVPVAQRREDEKKEKGGNGLEHPVESKNDTGMPDQLKSGIEQLSGHSMDDVKVHYNSDKPAQMKAHAYAQGTDIHLGAGQEKHLPHEAWHVVQQKQGRVNPTVQMKTGAAINDDPGLEKEADVMGAKASHSFAQHTSLPVQRKTASKASFPVVQRMPMDILGQLKPHLKSSKHLEVFNQILSLLANAESLSDVPYKMGRRAIGSTRSALLQEIQKLIKPDKIAEFLDIWNKELSNRSALYLRPRSSKVENSPPPDAKKRERDDESMNSTKRTDKPKRIRKSFIMTNEQWNAIQAWFDTPLTDKSSFPSKKLGKLVSQSDVMFAKLPEDFWVSLKLFFVHTATFSPSEKQGKDINDSSQGAYSRTSKSKMKDLVREKVMEAIKQLFPLEETTRKTVRAYNEPLRETLEVSGSLSSNIKGMEKFAVGGNKNMTAGLYKSAQGSHTGSLGFPSNSIKSMRMVERLEREKSKPNYVKTGPELKELIGKVNPQLLKGKHEGENYHDFMLQDRAALVQQVSQWMAAQPLLKGAKIETIQSEEHPSLIIYHPKYVDGTNEKEWRELMIQEFNTAAADLGFASRLNRRASFGFLYPTISSVGGPVRIWPGLLPQTIFQSIMKHTIAGVYNQMNPSAKVTLDKNETDIADGKMASEKGPLVHQEALRTAVRHSLRVMSQAENRPEANGIYKWILQRLSNNLEKAQFLLGKTDWLKNQKGKETHYLKSTLVIENLMEFTYMLQALVLEGNKPKNDPYPAHAKNALLPAPSQKGKEKEETVKKDLATFYLDSGMQAIVAANLLAKEHQKTNGKDKPKSNMEVLDLNSYFEYASVHKSNLGLQEFDYTKSGRPDIISADLNPVLNAPNSRKPTPEVAIPHYSEKNGDGKTIPIIDITNSTLNKAAKLNLGEHYENFIVLESLTKHHQLGADKFTMGRLNAVGSPEFLQLAQQIVGRIALNAEDPLWLEYRLSMDQAFYGNEKEEESNGENSEKESSGGKSGTSESSGMDDDLLNLEPLKHEDVRLDASQGRLLAFTSDGVKIFEEMERGVMDHMFRTNSCGFLTLDTTREQFQTDLLTTIQTGNHPQIQRMLSLIGDQIYNSVIHGEEILLSQKNIQEINRVNQRFDIAEQERADEIVRARAFLVENRGDIFRGMDMNIEDAMGFVESWNPSEREKIMEKIMMLFSLQLAKHKKEIAVAELDRLYTSPDLALDYLQNNLLGQQQMGHNTARAWAIANNIELHIWTQTATPGLIQEISPQDVIAGASTIHMLHTGNRTHFRELIPQ